MQRHRRRILATIAGIATVGALIAAALIVVPARATPSTGVTTTILAKSLFDDIHVKAHTRLPERWKAQLKTHGESDVYVVDNKFAPGGTAGWHSHPGPSLILVVSGTVTNYLGDDPNCTPHTYTAGDGFIDPGSGHMHLLRNETGAPAETIAVQLLPKDAERRIDVPEAPRQLPLLDD
jgi:quercetin dioxygenase-like cupin family protein